MMGFLLQLHWIYISSWGALVSHSISYINIFQPYVKRIIQQDHDEFSRGIKKWFNIRKSTSAIHPKRKKRHHKIFSLGTEKTFDQHQNSFIKALSRLEVERNFFSVLKRDADNFFPNSEIGTKVLLYHISLTVLARDRETKELRFFT